jgi:hypothetical protein
MSRIELGCRVHLPQFPGVLCPVTCNSDTAVVALPVIPTVRACCVVVLV